MGVLDNNEIYNYANSKDLVGVGKMAGTFKKEQKVSIINEKSGFAGLSGVVKEVRQGGGLLVEIEGHGKMRFSALDCK